MSLYRDLEDKRANKRDFVVGEGVVDPIAPVFHQRADDPPKKFEDYLTTSNSVFSILQMRSALLTTIPLKLFRIKGRAPRRLTPEWRSVRQRIQVELMSAASAPSKFRRQLLKSNLEEVTSGPLVDLLVKVNPHWTQTKLLRMTDQSIGIWGRTYWVLEFGGGIFPKEIWWVKAPFMNPIPHQDDYISGFEFLSDKFHKPIPFDSKEVIWFNNASIKDEYAGLSPMSSTGVYADHEIASMQANLNLHKQGLQMGGIVHPKEGITWTSTQAQEVERDINRRFAGVTKAHRWGAFRHEVDLHEVGVTPDDAEFLEGLNWDLEASARAYNWPLDLLGGKRTYQNVQGAMIAAYVFSVLPQGHFIASELTEQLIPLFPDEGDLFFFDSSGVSVLQEAEKAAWSIESDQISKGAITINEWRDSQGLPLVSWGDTWWAPKKVQPINGDTAAVLVSGDEEDIDRAFDELLTLEDNEEPSDERVQKNGKVPAGV